jgi:6-phospho-beta-glucosidase
MKLAVIGAAGMRTPLIVEAILQRQERLALDELALMDFDRERLELIQAITASLEQAAGPRPTITRTTDLRQALSSADFVITTFRVGGIESRVIDERVPLAHGVLGQETTGPGGFAMAMRGIPVLLGIVSMMQEVCPEAWLVNFANPAGILAEAARRAGNWKRTVGICDAPSMMQRVAAALLGVNVQEVFLDYFGLNHLGWVRAVVHRGEDYLPQFIALIRAAGRMPGLPFDPQFVSTLGMIPNEYLYYYYHSAEAVDNILRQEQTRGEYILSLNSRLLRDLRRFHRAGDTDSMRRRYQAYLRERGKTYMQTETGLPADPQLETGVTEQDDALGYAGVALDLIEGLSAARGRAMILNVANAGAIQGMDTEDVVEIPALVDRDFVRPLAVGQVPDHALALMKQVKAYERLTVEAAVEGSYAKALQALTLHPLLADLGKARMILDEYRQKHGSLFPQLH